MDNLIYESSIKTNREEFISKVRSISRKLGIAPNWLMGVMYIETGGTFSARIANPYTGAVGLIQFMPTTANELGTTVEKLALMSDVEQLDYVYKYLSRYKYKMNTFVDCYFAVFFPAAMRKPNDFIIQTSSLSAGLIARQNPGYDLDKNQAITVYEVETSLLAKFTPDVQELLKKKV